MHKLNNTVLMDKPEMNARTLGDGMDNTLVSLTDFMTRNITKFKLGNSKGTLKPVIPQGRIIKTIPKYIPKERKSTGYLVRKQREPKFVPCEPYKGAVDPIQPRKKSLRLASGPPRSKNNVDIQDLVLQMADMRSTEFNKLKMEENIESFIPKKQWEEERANYETDIKNLRETNAHLENQLKFQAQVNSELKTLLVAAVGEDLESRVQHLTEDKLQLARALLNSATHLTSHQEQTEWLSGQCEVWRSKFLASSLMVEELARWKSALSNRINELQGNIKILVDERVKVRDYSLHCYDLLMQLNDADRFKKLKSANIIDLALSNQSLAENLARKSIGSVHYNEDLQKLPANTPGENTAVRMLKNPVVLTGKPDAICDALKDAALSVSAGQMYLQHPNKHATCCRHCKGEVLVI